MKTMIKWFTTLFDPSIFNNLNMDELMAAMQDGDVRAHWIRAVLDEIKDGNMRTHAALMNGELTKKFGQESARLQGIDWVLRQILNSKTSIAMERHHNQADALSGMTVTPAP